ncbi:MAG: holo-ACP synthase [Symploca sp. SIO1B1]|nr:holo-ACP synthase [Symploca sp. SIO1C2]NER99323.1 holo-ACP synthase [Symploca sp. SIO1B1]
MPISRALPNQILIGYDIQSIKELQSKSALLSSPNFFSEYERNYCLKKKEPTASFAGILCVKEAFIKAISGISGIPYFTFSDFEVRHSYNGRPKVLLKGHISQWCEARAIDIDVSISHSGGFAAATVLLYIKGNVCEKGKLCEE